MSAPELKPCPFCGGEADIDHDHTVEENHAYGCRICSVWFDTFNADDAISAWNRRADLCDPTQDERVKALVDALRKVIEEYDEFLKDEYMRGLSSLDDEIHDARAALRDMGVKS